MALALLFTPVPMADHEVPSYLAMLFIANPPAVPKLPATNRLPRLSAAIDLTYTPDPVIPDPIADQATPFHLAILAAETPLIAEKPPAAYRLLDGSKVIALMVPPMDPNTEESHAEPFQRAIFSYPAIYNPPPLSKARE